MKQKVLLLMVLVLGMCSINANAQAKKRFDEKDGFVWYLVTNDKGEPKVEVSGKTIVPYGHYNFLEYADYGYFMVNRENTDFFSLYSPTGEQIIDETSHIIFPRAIKEDDGHMWIYCLKPASNLPWGIYDKWGKEIVPPTFDFSSSDIEYSTAIKGFVNKKTGKAINVYIDYQDRMYKIDSNGNRLYISDDPALRVPRGLRYKGLYTISSQGRSQTYGGYTGIAGSDLETEIEIYDDYIMVGTTKCTFDKVSGGERAYSSKGWGVNGWHTYSTYYVDSNYNIRRVDTSSGQFGTDWFEYEVAKGRCTMPKYQPQFGGSSASGGGGSRYGSGSSTYNQNQTGKKVRTACRSCMYTNGKCSVCKGTGRQRTSAAGYSTTTECRNCGGSGRCPTCGGDGWIN